MKTLSDLSISQVFESNFIPRKCWNSHNLILRTERSVKFHGIPNEIINKSELKPISDYPIIKNLNIFQFTHPQLLISFLSLRHPSSNSKIKDILYPYLLVPDFSMNNVIYAIANSLSLTPKHLLQNFSSNLDCKKAKKEWEKRFSGLPIDTNLKITEKWNLNSLNDLEALHLLACSVNCKVYLLFNLSSPTNNEESTLFSTIIGPTNESSYCTFFLCESPTKIIYARPMNFSKQNNHLHPNFSLLKRVTLPSKKYAIYLNFPQLLKEISSKSSSFNSISTHFIIDPSISEPVLSFTYSDILKIEIRHPNDDYSYSELLEKLEHITPSFSTTEPALIDERSLFNFESSPNRKVKIHSNSLITVHSVQERAIELSKIHEIKEISQIEKLAFAFCSLNFPPLTKSSDMKLFQLIRFLTPFITNYKSFELEKIESAPIITTHTDDFSLSAAARHPYATFLCLYSIFNAASKSETIICQKCHKNRHGEETILIPVRTVTNDCLISPFLTWICIGCFKKLTNREKLAIKGQFPMFHEIVDVENLKRVQSPHNMSLAIQAAADRIHMSIMSIRSQPIGSLRALVPRIDAAFEELVSIMKMFRQRLIRMKNVTADDLATVRDSDEYVARIGASQRAVRVQEPDIEVVDYKMFELYLAGFTEKGAGVTDYLLTQPESSIKQDMIDVAAQAMQELYTTISSSLESIEIKYTNRPTKNEQNSNNDNNNNDNNNNDNNCNNNDNDNNNDSNCNNNDNDNNNNDNDDNCNKNCNDDICDDAEKGNVSFEVDLKCASGGVQCSPICKNVYEVHMIENGNYITSSPVFTIKTRKHLSGVCLYKESDLLIIANDKENLTTELYCVPLSNTDLDILSTSAHNDSYTGEDASHTSTSTLPGLVIEGMSSCEASFSYDASSVALLGTGGDENPLYVVTYNDDSGNWQLEKVGTFPATKITWLANSDSAILAANEDSYYVMRFGQSEDDEEDNAPIIDLPKHEGSLIKLVASFNSAWAIFDSGECIPLSLTASSANEEEEEEFEDHKDDRIEEDDEKNEGKIKFNCKVVDGYLTSDNGEIGITVIDEFGKLHFRPSLTPQKVTPAVNMQPSYSHNSYNFPSGIFRAIENETGHFTCNQVALSLVEMFPALVGYFFRSTFFLMEEGKSTLKSYHPQNKNRFLISSIRSFYVNEMMHVSLHHVEESLFQMENLNAKVVTFIDFGLQNSASFIDSIFGSSLAYCECDGVWTTVKAVNGLVYIIVYIKALSTETKNQILFDATIASLLCNRKVYFLTESEVALFDILTKVNDSNVISSSNGFTAFALIFMRNSAQKIFEYKTIEASLNNCIQNVKIKVVNFELFDDYSEIPFDNEGIDLDDSILNQNEIDKIRENCNDMLGEIDPIDIGTAIDDIKKMVSLMSTLYQFQNVDPSSVISNCF